jgi:23S rRNA pseudouridine1911/1915/1917 synthase
MEYLKHPIVGDPSYGRGLNFSHTLSPKLSAGLQAFKRQALHAWRLSFIHPETQKLLSLEAAPPNDFSAILDLLRDEDTHDY